MVPLMASWPKKSNVYIFFSKSWHAKWSQKTNWKIDACIRGLWEVSCCPLSLVLLSKKGGCKCNRSWFVYGATPSLFFVFFFYSCVASQSQSPPPNAVFDKAADMIHVRFWVWLCSRLYPCMPKVLACQEGSRKQGGT